MMIDGKTQLMGLIGWPVSHSFSPAMHNAAAAALGLNMVYVPLPVRSSEVRTAVTGLGPLGFRGANVTVPHKQAVIPFLSTIGPGVQAIGAVNTIIFDRAEDNSGEGWHLSGYNTDWSGILEDLAALEVTIQGRDCLILGAGGSARAVAYGLHKAGGFVQVLARRVAQAEALAAGIAATGVIKVDALAHLGEIVSRLTAPLIINTTPLGMTPNVTSSIWPAALPFPPGAFAYDLVYNPQDTLFMQQARGSGCQASNGLGMLIRQGAKSFELWTGVKPDLDVMKNALPF